MRSAGYSGALNRAAQQSNNDTSARWWMIIVLVCLIVVLLALLWTTRSQAPGFPGESSAEAGFARDMVTHHAQAVRMALLVHERGEHETLRTIALDMLLTQQAQIGQMQGWLRVWGLPLSGVDLPMTWMGMPTAGLMPGMATDDQLAALGAASGAEADRLFIDLMIPHHIAGVHMAEAVIEQTEVNAVRELAGSMVAVQQIEIEELERIRVQIPETMEMADPAPAAETGSHNH
jgi:uncharacterized protein (DUF305 family)